MADFNYDDVVSQLSKDGFYSKESFITTEDLEQLEKLVVEKKKIKSNFRLNTPDLQDTYVYSSDFSSKVKEFVDGVSESLKLEDYKKQDIYKVLRVVSGVDQKKEAGLYHFDAHAITLLIPIIIPNRENSGNGDLIIFPNLRKITKSLLFNIITKLFFQNSVSRFLIQKSKLVQKIFRYKKLKLKPGNIYIFLGFRTLHGNLEIDARDTRATLLVHFYDVFSESSLVEKNRQKNYKKYKI
jgi:hypothetical protein